jgi:hypothetical protein
MPPMTPPSAASPAAAPKVQVPPVRQVQALSEQVQSPTHAGRLAPDEPPHPSTSASASGETRCTKRRR